VECEITGIDSTPDGRTIFINIQHPGEDVSNDQFAAGQFTSNWPANQNDPAARARPRSATVVVTKNDGAVVAL
jgi:secreted PhoX family phosphatase